MFSSNYSSRVSIGTKVCIFWFLIFIFSFYIISNITLTFPIFSPSFCSLPTLLELISGSCDSFVFFFPLSFLCLLPWDIRRGFPPYSKWTKTGNPWRTTETTLIYHLYYYKKRKRSFYIYAIIKNGILLENFIPETLKKNNNEKWLFPWFYNGWRAHSKERKVRMREEVN